MPRNGRSLLLIGRYVELEFTGQDLGWAGGFLLPWLPSVLEGFKFFSHKLGVLFCFFGGEGYCWASLPEGFLFLFLNV